MTPQGAGYLFECLSFNESLRYLDVSSYEGSYRNKLGSKGAEYFRDYYCSSSNFALEYFKIAGNYIGNEGIEFLSHGIMNTQNRNLMHLDIS